MMKDKRITVAYCRLSQDDYEKDNEYSSSIYNQLEIIKSYASKLGLTIDKEYIDDGYSGINFERPSFERLKNDIDKGIIGIVITKDISRLGRDLFKTIYYISEYFLQNNVRYIAINDQYDSEIIKDSELSFMLYFRSLINDRYVKDASIKRKQVAEYKTGNKEYIGSIAPYGYKIDKINNRRTLIVDNYAAGIVKRIFNEVASGKSRKMVARMLNEERIKSPTTYMNIMSTKDENYCNEWNAGIIYRILRNNTYTGRIVKRKSLKHDYHLKKRDYIPYADRETIDRCHPPIVDDELYIAANNKIKTYSKRLKSKYNGLFLNLVICGECGKIMKPYRIKRKNRKLNYYFMCNENNEQLKCSNRRISDDKLKKIIFYKLRGIIDSYVNDEYIISMMLKKIIKREKSKININNFKIISKQYDHNIRELYLKKTMCEIDLDEFIRKKDLETLRYEKAREMIANVLEIQNENLLKKNILEKYRMFIGDKDYIGSILKIFIEQVTIYKDNTIIISFKFDLGEKIN